MTRRAWILMLTLAALWGASYMFIKIALDHGVSDPLVVFLRTLLGAAVLAPVALSRGAFRAARPYAGWLALIAAVQIVGPFLLITIGEHHVTSSMAGILVSSAPIFTTLIAVLVARDDRLHGVGLAGIVVGIAGVALLFGVDLGGDSAALLGGAGILLASLGYAVGATVAKRKLANVPPVGIAASIMSFSALALLPVVPFADPEVPSLGASAALVALGAGGTGAAFLIFYILNGEIGPSRASVVAYIAPVFSVLYGVTLLDEAFTLATACGLLLILAGSWMAADGRVPRRRGASRSEPSRSSAPEPARAR
jgi:drug/metabolite transporter (DMT)-like permease